MSPACTARDRLEEAEQYYLRGNLNEALAAAQQAWREQPREPDVFRVLAYLHMARGEYTPAEQAARQALALDPDGVLSFATLAQVFLAFGMYRSADDILTQASLSFPYDPALLALRADLRFRQLRDAEASQLATAALEQNPHDGYTKALLGQFYLRRRRFSEAMPLLRDAVAAYPQRADYLRDFGVAQLDWGDAVGARKALEQSCQLNPTDPTSKQHLLFALRWAAGQSRLTWKMARFFYYHTGLGWTMSLLGTVTLVIGLICLLAAVINLPALNLEMLLSSSLRVPSILCAFGLLLVLCPHAGISLRGYKGKRFDVMLQRLGASTRYDA